VTTNELTLAKAFRDAGINQESAEHLAETIFGAIRENVATKADLERLEQATRADLQQTAHLLNEEIQRFRIDVERSIHLLTMRGLAAAVSLFFALLTALHYWPPH